jgi:ADP-ribosylglycohydrolase
MKSNICKDILFGIAVGDALGVPVEFKSRETIAKNPVKEMKGYGTHNQPPGTWSDDSSLAFCLAESLCNDYNINDIASNFVKWLDEGFWTPYGKVFDIGNTTHNAISNLKNGCDPVLAGETGIYSNGNGSLMRILPLLIQIVNLNFQERCKLIREVSSITHGHPRSVLGCVILMEYAIYLMHEGPRSALWTLSLNLRNEFEDLPELENELIHFNRLFDGMTSSEFEALRKTDRKAYEATKFMDASMPSITKVSVDEIRSSGYIVDTLEASIWCLINSTSYEEAVLLAVNLGDDTDTTGAVTGGLAALYYGYDSIPENWVNQIARKDDINELSERLYTYYLNLNFKHKCPICAIELKKLDRYPDYICPECAKRATDISGQSLTFFNLGVGGGFGAQYSDSGKEYLSHECYIDGRHCWADEARFGGIVVQILNIK